METEGASDVSESRSTGESTCLRRPSIRCARSQFLSEWRCRRVCPLLSSARTLPALLCDSTAAVARKSFLHAAWYGKEYRHARSMAASGGQHSLSRATSCSLSRSEPTKQMSAASCLCSPHCSVDGVDARLLGEKERPVSPFPGKCGHATKQLSPCPSMPQRD